MNKNVIIAIVVILVIALVLYAYNASGKSSYKRTDTTTNKDTSPTGSGEVVTAPTTSPVNNFPLKEGMKSEHVLILQKGLNKVYSSDLAEDSHFGELTGDAAYYALGDRVVSFEKYSNLLKESSEDDSMVDAWIKGWNDYWNIEA